MKTVQEAMAAKGLAMPTTETPAVTPIVVPASEATTTTTTDSTTVDTTQGAEITTPDVSTDILSRVAKVDSVVTEPEDTSAKFNVNDIDTIEDPKAKEIVTSAYKSFEKGYQKKFQEVADMRKELETKLATDGTFTKEKIATLLSNPEFINGAQAYMQSQNPTDGTMSDAEWSGLSDTEKSQINVMQQKLTQLEQANKQADIRAEVARQDSELGAKYANYDSVKVNQLRDDMMTGKIRATNEHLYKVLTYESAINKAYTMGKEDRKLELGEKINASTVIDNDNRTVVTTETAVRNDGESPKQFLIRRLHENFLKSKK